MSRRFNLYFSIFTVLVLGGLLALSACSEQKSSSSSTTHSQPSGGVLQPVGTKIPDVQPQKTEKKSRPLTETWHSSTYGVSFDYPSKYSLTWGTQARLEPDGSQPVTMFTQEGGHRIAIVRMHSGFFPKTDLDYAFFSVSVNRHLAADQCSKFNSKTESHSDTAEGIVIGDKQSETRYVHDFVNNACYELALGLKTRDTSAIDSDALRPVDRQRVFAKLQEMLESVSFDADQEIDTPDSTVSQPGTSEVKPSEVKPAVKPETKPETKNDTKTPQDNPATKPETKPQPDNEPLGS